MEKEKANLKISVIIPARSEEGTIARVINQVKPFVDEIIVVDGHSKDNTIAVAKGLNTIVIKQKGYGKGDAMQTGVNFSKADIIVFIDADGSHEPRDIPKLIDPIINNEADLIVGSRYLGGSDEFIGSVDNFIRMVGSGILTLIVNIKYKIQLTDIENGFRAIKKRVFEKLNLKAKDFTIEQEMIIKALKGKYRIKEIASHEYERKGGKSKLPTMQGWKFVWRFFITLFR